MREQAVRVLDGYFQTALGRTLSLPDAALIDRQRRNFLGFFGPQALTEMTDAELLRQLPYNRDNDQPMDYWLEFRNDAIFNQRLFGGIAGGSAGKFGTWQDKKSGSWRTRLRGSASIRDVSEAVALDIVRQRRSEMLAAVRALQAFAARPCWEIEPRELQKAVATAAPRWHENAWLHKYLHLNHPELITWRATPGYLQAGLYRLGETVPDAGMYACDVRLIQFWSSLPALASLPVACRYRLGEGLVPREHWCFIAAGGAEAWEELLAAETLALGPPQLDSLAGLFSLSKRTEVCQGLERAFREAGIAPGAAQLQDLLKLGHALREGSLVALLSDATTVRAVGEVAGSYRYARAGRPHRIPVRWLHRHEFELSTALLGGRGSLLRLCSTDPRVAELETSLLLNGVGIWPDFERVVGSMAGVHFEPMPPSDAVLAQLLEMLERKKQIILYGPPATGKTYYAQRIALEMISRHNFHCLPSQLSMQQQERIQGRDGTEPFMALCSFHPEYGYEDFIEGYRPETQGFNLKPGLFKRLARAALAHPNKRYVLIIDEINRGNIPKIFGELITLMEPSKRGLVHALLPLSGEAFTVPANLYVVATMNTADRSILLLDIALRRRFGFRELLPREELLSESRIGDITLSAWLRALNRRIRERLGRDGRNLQVGHAFFMISGQPARDLASIAQIIREDIWPLLQEYCYEDPRVLAAILAAERGGIYDQDTDDLRYGLFEPGQEQALSRALSAIVLPADLDAGAEAMTGAVTELSRTD